jgi:hypothetical protein
MFDLEAAEKLLRNVVIVLVVLIIGVVAVFALNSGGVLDLPIGSFGGSVDDNSEDPVSVASSGNAATQVNSKPNSGLNAGISSGTTGQQSSQSGTAADTRTANSTVAAATPILPEDPYASDLHAQDQPEEEPEQELIEIFSDSFFLEYDHAVAYTVDVAKGPLEIRYRTHAYKETSYDSWVEITVRDADSNEIVAQDGFRRVFSSETEQQMTVRDEGRFHITIQGRWVDVDVAFLTGG